MKKVLSPANVVTEHTMMARTHVVHVNRLQHRYVEGSIFLLQLAVFAGMEG